MNAPEKFFLPDVQSSADHRALAIQQVGVRGLRYPMAVRDLDGGVLPRPDTDPATHQYGIVAVG